MLISQIFLHISVLNWCLSHKFELVELEQTEDLEPDPEGNKYGIERIVEALHAHTWPNIILKGCILNLTAKLKIFFSYRKIKVCTFYYR